jgi:hypothetical protein
MIFWVSAGGLCVGKEVISVYLFFLHHAHRPRPHGTPRRVRAQAAQAQAPRAEAQQVSSKCECFQYICCALEARSCVDARVCVECACVFSCLVWSDGDVCVCVQCEAHESDGE